jgi:hypothetical protein
MCRSISAYSIMHGIRIKKSFEIVLYDAFSLKSFVAINMTVSYLAISLHYASLSTKINTRTSEDNTILFFNFITSVSLNICLTN